LPEVQQSILGIIIKLQRKDQERKLRERRRTCSSRLRPETRMSPGSSSPFITAMSA
jgi:hypothetical protein